MHEIALTRIFSVTMWYHFAFVAVSVAMFGLTFGGLPVYLLPAPFPDGVKRRMAAAALLSSSSIPICLTQLRCRSPWSTIRVAIYVIALTYAVDGRAVRAKRTRRVPGSHALPKDRQPAVRGRSSRRRSAACCSSGCCR